MISVKGDRGQMFKTMKIVIFITDLPVKGTWWCAKLNHQEAKNNFQHFNSHGLQFIITHNHVVCNPKFFRVFQKFAANHTIHSPGLAGLKRLRHFRLGDHTIFIYQIHSHVPLTAILDRVSKQMHHQSLFHS